MIDSLKFLASTLKTDRRGVTAVEYALVAGALVAGVATAFGVLTGALQTYFGTLTF